MDCETLLPLPPLQLLVYLTFPPSVYFSPSHDASVPWYPDLQNPLLTASSLTHSPTLHLYPWRSLHTRSVVCGFSPKLKHFFLKARGRLLRLRELKYFWSPGSSVNSPDPRIPKFIRPTTSEPVQYDDRTLGSPQGTILKTLFHVIEFKREY